MISSKVAKSIKTFLTAYNLRILSCLHAVLLYYVELYLLYSHATTCRPPQKAVQIITKSPSCAHSYPLFKTLHILDIFKIYKHRLSCFVSISSRSKTSAHHSLLSFPSLSLIFTSTLPGKRTTFTSIFTGKPSSLCVIH